MIKKLSITKIMVLEIMRSEGEMGLFIKHNFWSIKRMIKNKTNKNSKLIRNKPK